MQLLIGDMIQKFDPNGKIQTNDLDDWIQERLTPAVTRQTTAPEHATDLDTKPPAQPTDSITNSITNSETAAVAINDESGSYWQDPANFAGIVDESDFKERWRRAERRVHLLSQTSSDDAEQPAIGAIRMIGPNAREDSELDVDNDVDNEWTEEPDASTPLTAHVVVDKDLEPKKLNEAVAEIQQKQTIIEATVRRAEPVYEDVHDDDDDDPSFLELYGDTILISLLACGVGILIGFRMSHSRGVT